MVKIVVASVPGFGHLYSVMPLAQACRRLGHDVVVATGPEFTAARLGMATASLMPAGHSLSGVEQETSRRHPELREGSGEPWRFAVELFADVTAGLVTPTMIDLFQRTLPDLVIYDSLTVGAGVAADICNVPAVAHLSGQWNPMMAAVHATAVERQAALWHQHGRTPPTRIQGVLGGRLLDRFPPALHDPDFPLPEGSAPTRPVPWAAPADPAPDWPPTSHSLPAVYLTFGTVAYGAIAALRTALDALSRLDVETVVTVGPDGDLSALNPLPANTRVERFLPQSQVLARVDAVVHHGGAGTLLGAAAYALPQVVLPQGADQHVNGAALARSGAGVTLPSELATTEAIAAAVSRVLADGPERAAARLLFEQIAAMPEPDLTIAQLTADGGTGPVS